MASKVVGCPVTSAFLVCDRIITEAGTNKKTLVGVFTILRARAFPTQHRQVALYYKGMLESGKHEFNIDLVRRGEENTLSSVEGVLVVKDARSPTELAINLPFLDIPAEGTYEFRFWIDGAYVQRAAFVAAKYRGEV